MHPLVKKTVSDWSCATKIINILCAKLKDDVKSEKSGNSTKVPWNFRNTFPCDPSPAKIQLRDEVGGHWHWKEGRYWWMVDLWSHLQGGFLGHIPGEKKPGPNIIEFALSLQSSGTWFWYSWFMLISTKHASHGLMAITASKATPHLLDGWLANVQVKTKHSKQDLKMTNNSPQSWSNKKLKNLSAGFARCSSICCRIVCKEHFWFFIGSNFMATVKVFFNMLGGGYPSSMRSLHLKIRL